MGKLNQSNINYTDSKSMSHTGGDQESSEGVYHWNHCGDYYTGITAGVITALVVVYYT